tara:strand:+ start:2148 stop:2291 length:144 start_codon:yes stop_codon:yes gene_type:complete
LCAFGLGSGKEQAAGKASDEGCDAGNDSQIQGEVAISDLSKVGFEIL